MTTRFDRDTAVTPLGDGVYEARIDTGWWIVRGPNGGYLAAILLRALEAAVDDPTRSPRSLTIHYTRPPAEGPVRIETHVERTGRSLTTVTARMLQGDKLQAMAIAAFSKPREATGFHHAVMPEVAAPDSLERLPTAEMLSMRARYEQCWAVGALPWTGTTPDAVAGGWIRLAEPRELSAPLLAAYSDAWPPAVFSSSAVGALQTGVPTIDLTLHFRASLPLPNAKPNDFTLAVFRTRESREGFIEEDGELWSADGVLLAQSRQLAILG